MPQTRTYGTMSARIRKPNGLMGYRVFFSLRLRLRKKNTGVLRPPFFIQTTCGGRTRRRTGRPTPSPTPTIHRVRFSPDFRDIALPQDSKPRSVPPATSLQPRPATRKRTPLRRSDTAPRTPRAAHMPLTYSPRTIPDTAPILAKLFTTGCIKPTRDTTTLKGEIHDQ
jgi:hypothetical protein